MKIAFFLVIFFYIYTAMNQTFQKTEILKSKTAFSDLIANGESAKKFPFVLIWKQVDTTQEYPLKTAFAVSKKRFPLAVDRNEMKRKIKEIYRVNKARWYNHLKDNYTLLLIYTSKEKLKSSEMEPKLKQVFDRFIANVDSSN